MDIGVIRGKTRVLGQAQGYRALPIVDTIEHDSATGQDVPVMHSAWFPTPDELALLNAGAPVILSLFGTNHPPCRIDVGGIEQPEGKENGQG